MNQDNHLIRPIISEDIAVQPKPNQPTLQLRRLRMSFAIFLTLQWLHWPLLIGGSLASVYAFWLEQTGIRTLVLGLYSVIWLIKIWSFLQRRRYGQIKDGHGRPIAHAVIQLTAAVNGTAQHVLSTISDRNGRFVLLASPGWYEMTVTKEGYRLEQRVIEAEKAHILVTLRPN